MCACVCIIRMCVNVHFCEGVCVCECMCANVCFCVWGGVCVSVCVLMCIGIYPGLREGDARHDRRSGNQAR